MLGESGIYNLHFSPSLNVIWSFLTLASLSSLLVVHFPAAKEIKVAIRIVHKDTLT